MDLRIGSRWRGVGGRRGGPHSDVGREKTGRVKGNEGWKVKVHQGHRYRPVPQCRGYLGLMSNQ
jgi:hypothetical protein